MYILGVFLLWTINSACSQSQCGSYKNLTDPALRTDNSGLIPVQIPVGWYRYTGTDAGIMATSCPNGNNQCGAKYQVWIKGVFPVLSNGSVTVEACIRTVITDGTANCCGRKNQLRMENCGLFYIYFLVPLPPETHVCFNNTAIKLTTTSTPTSLPTSTTPGSQLSNTTTGTTNEQRIVTPGTTVMTNTNLNVNVSGKPGFKTELGAYIGGAVILTVIAIVLLFIGIRKYITSRQKRVNNFDANAHQDERNAESNYQDVSGIFKSSDNMIPLRRFNPRSLYESSCASSK